MSDETHVEMPPYEPPRVDRVLTADELAREIHYAGAGGSAGPG